MRKIVTGLFMSLDGVVESPEDWASQYADDQMREDIAAGIAQADGVLLGRRTYRQFAQMWPGQPSDLPMAAFLNNTHKYVVSATLDKLEWGPASLITGDVAAEIAELKRRPGKNIQVPGSPTLVRWLLCGGLLDELSLSICPIVVGSGMRLFEDTTGQVRLTVAESRTFSTGAVGMTYQPEPRSPGRPIAAAAASGQQRCRWPGTVCPAGHNRKGQSDEHHNLARRSVSTWARPARPAAVAGAGGAGADPIHADPPRHGGEPRPAADSARPARPATTNRDGVR